MENYPEVVARIANDYLERVRSQLRLVPARDRDEFVKELQSHVYEAYQQTPGEDDVGRILTVLRNLGEPAEVVADRLPGAMVRNGARRSLPLYIVGGIFIALFGVPLGFGGMGVLLGLLVALAGVVFAYYAVAGSVLLVGAVFALLGLIRVYGPGLWDKLVALGIIQLDGGVAEWLDQMSRSAQGFLMIVVACVFLASGLGMLRLGKYMVRGLRFLFSLVFDWVRRFGQGVGRQLRRDNRETPHVSQASFVK